MASELPSEDKESHKHRSCSIITKTKSTLVNVFNNSIDLAKNFWRLTYKSFKNRKNPNYQANTTPLDRQFSKALDKSQLSLLKMPLEIRIGRTFDGEKLTWKDKILYALIAATNWFTYVGWIIAVKEQDATLWIYAWISYGVSRWLYTIQRTPNLIRDLKILAKEKWLQKLTQILTLLEQVAMKDGFAKIHDLQKKIQEKIKTLLQKHQK